MVLGQAIQTGDLSVHLPPIPRSFPPSDSGQRDAVAGTAIKDMEAYWQRMLPCARQVLEVSIRFFQARLERLFALVLQPDFSMSTATSPLPPAQAQFEAPSGKRNAGPLAEIEVEEGTITLHAMTCWLQRMALEVWRTQASMLTPGTCVSQMWTQRCGRLQALRQQLDQPQVTASLAILQAHGASVVEDAQALLR